MTNKDITPYLEDALAALKKSEKVYEKAVEIVHSESFTKKLNDIYQERKNFVSEMEVQFKQRSLDPSEISADTKQSFLHKIWLQSTELFTEKNMPDVLETCIDVDQSIIDCFDPILEKNELADGLKEMLNRQYNRTLQQITEMKGQLKDYPWFESKYETM